MYTPLHASARAFEGLLLVCACPLLRLFVTHIGVHDRDCACMPNHRDYLELVRVHDTLQRVTQSDATLTRKRSAPHLRTCSVCTPLCRLSQTRPGIPGPLQQPHRGSAPTHAPSHPHDPNNTNSAPNRIFSKLLYTRSHSASRAPHTAELTTSQPQCKGARSKRQAARLETARITYMITYRALNAADLAEVGQDVALGGVGEVVDDVVHRALSGHDALRPIRVLQRDVIGGRAGTQKQELLQQRRN